MLLQCPESLPPPRPNHHRCTKKMSLSLTLSCGEGARSTIQPLHLKTLKWHLRKGRHSQIGASRRIRGDVATWRRNPYPSNRLPLSLLALASIGKYTLQFHLTLSPCHLTTTPVGKLGVVLQLVALTITDPAKDMTLSEATRNSPLLNALTPIVADSVSILPCHWFPMREHHQMADARLPNPKACH